MSSAGAFAASSLVAESEGAVWLYGSHSRGDCDELSDLDVLHVSDYVLPQNGYRQRTGTGRKATVSWYAWTEMERMASYGSLFLHHLRLEGTIVAESASCRGRLTKVLETMGPYQLAPRDLIGFRRVLDDVIESLDDGQASLFYELSTLGTVFRHASILACALEGSYCFSRTGPVERVALTGGLPQRWVKEFVSLYNYRLFVDGRIQECPEPSVELARAWCSRTQGLLEELGRRIRG